MLATRWEPMAEMSRLRRDFDRLFGITPKSHEGSFPSFNIWETDNAVCLEAELPGFSTDDLDISIDGTHALTIHGERDQPEMEGSWHRCERAFGKFLRRFDLPAYVDIDRVEADYSLGVLSITLPKRKEKKARQIKVNVTGG